LFPSLFSSPWRWLDSGTPSPACWLS